MIARPNPSDHAESRWPSRIPVAKPNPSDHAESRWPSQIRVAKQNGGVWNGRNTVKATIIFDRFFCIILFYYNKIKYFFYYFFIYKRYTATRRSGVYFCFRM